MNQTKHLINKIFDLLKFCFTLGFIAFLLVKTPDQTAQVVSVSAAFILGGSAKIGQKLGF